MKRIISIIFVIFTLSILLNNWSSNIATQIADIVTPTQMGKMLLSSNLQLQRAMANTSIGLAINESAFIDQALVQVQTALRYLKKIPNYDAHRSQVNEIKSSIERLRQKRKSGEAVSKEELISLSLMIEQQGQVLHKSGRDYWESNLEIAEDLVFNFEKVNVAIKVFQAFSLLILLCLVYQMYRKSIVEREVRKKEKLHGLLFSSLSEAVFLCDQQGKILSCNNSCSLLTGVTPQEMVGNTLSDFFEQVRFSYKYGIDNLSDVVKKGVSFSSLIMSTIVNGQTKWFSLNAQPIINDNEKFSFSTILSLNDISETIEAEKTIKNQQLQLVESAKMQSIGEMASGIAHEINNPLTIISATSSRLSRKAQRENMISSSDIKATTDKIARTVERMGKIIRSLLTMSRGSKDRFERTSIEEIINMTLDFCLPTLESNKIKFSRQDLDENIKIDCHSTQISQVIVNLIKNSCDAIEEFPDKWISLRTVDKGDKVRIEVIDCGTGIPEKIRDQILLPFFTTKPVGKGTGLGLSISRNIAETHSGELGVDSGNPNTCFYIELPKVQDEYHQEIESTGMAE